MGISNQRARGGGLYRKRSQGEGLQRYAGAGSFRHTGGWLLDPEFLSPVLVIGVRAGAVQEFDRSPG